MEFIKTAKLYTIGGKDTIQIDCGSSFYSGIIEKTNIPEEFQDNYKDIITKSFEGFSDNSFNISSYFEHNDYSVNNTFFVKITFKNNFYNFDKTINIPLTITQKDKVDYLEEKLIFEKEKVIKLEEKLEQTIKELEMIKEKIFGNQKQKKVYKMTEIEDSQDNQTSESESESESETEEIQNKKKNVMKKKHTQIKKL